MAGMEGTSAWHVGMDHPTATSFPAASLFDARISLTASMSVPSFGVVLFASRHHLVEDPAAQPAMVCGEGWIVEAPVEKVVIFRLCIPLLRGGKRCGASGSEMKGGKKVARQIDGGIRRWCWREGGREEVVGSERKSRLEEATRRWKERGCLTLIGVCNVISIQCLCAS